MAWFSGKVTLGNFADIFGAVNRLSENEKNIENNFDTALGFEDKAGGLLPLMKVAQLLVGLAERPTPSTYPRFVSFCRVVTRLFDDELNAFINKLKPYFRKYEYPKRVLLAIIRSQIAQKRDQMSGLTVPRSKHFGQRIPTSVHFFNLFNKYSFSCLRF
ncbi:putative DNA ligase (ATP) [Helianthus debilis subsp. tardiflorus]